LISAGHYPYVEQVGSPGQSVKWPARTICHALVKKKKMLGPLFESKVKKGVTRWRKNLGTLGMPKIGIWLKTKTQRSAKKPTLGETH